MDDEPSIAATMPGILAKNGFETTVASTVTEALMTMYKENFEVLVADLCIGQPGDGYTVVSAMRRIQPQAVNVIMTGFPAFETALESIRSQVDDYLVKPTSAVQLVQKLKDVLASRQRRRLAHSKRVSSVLRQHGNDIIRILIAQMHSTGEVAATQLAVEKRVEHIPRLIFALIDMLETRPGHAASSALRAARQYGMLRYRQGYSIPSMVVETRLLQTSIYAVVQQHLLELEVRTIVPDIISIAESLESQLEEALRAYLERAPIEHLRPTGRPTSLGPHQKPTGASEPH